MLTEPLSFWGGLDSLTGHDHRPMAPAEERRVSNPAASFVMKAGRGSSSGSSVLAEAIRRGTGPAGIVLMTRDAIVTVGAMVATELYGVSCPVVAAPVDWPQMVRARRLTPFRQRRVRRDRCSRLRKGTLQRPSW